MRGLKFAITGMVIIVLLIGTGVSVGAQPGGVLTAGQPQIGAIDTAGAAVTYAYMLTAPRLVTLQAIGEGVQPQIIIYGAGGVVAQASNEDGSFILQWTVALPAGSYIVQVSAVNNTATGRVVLVVLNEMPLVETALTLGSPISAGTGSADPPDIYTFNAQPEAAYLHLDSDFGVHGRLIDAASGQVIGSIEPDVSGARWRIRAGDAPYRLEVEAAEGVPLAGYRVCLTLVGVGGCDVDSAPQPQIEPPPPQATAEVLPPPPATTPEVDASACTVSSSGGGSVNIRQSASTNAPIVGVLPGSGSAAVIGIAPDHSFYNVLYSGLNGWIAATVVRTSGNCAAVPSVNPPPFVPIPTATTAPPTNPPPTNPPPTVVSNEPCLIRMTDAALVYTQPDAIPDYIYDQVQAGYELIPTGRLANNSWWKTNYANAWIQTSLFGSAANVTGNCGGLPVVSP